MSTTSSSTAPDFVNLHLQHPIYYSLMQQSTDSPPSPPTHSSKARSQSPPPDNSLSQSNSESYPCQWLDCSSSFTDPEVLYNHLCNDHIGRKSTNNLCLTCKWKDCGTSCAKRDHITSHLRGTNSFLVNHSSSQSSSSPHPSQAPCMRGSNIFNEFFSSRSSFKYHLDMQEAIQATTGS